MAELRWMLDTNILSELIRNPQGPLTRRIAAVSAEVVCTSIIVACELRFGATSRGSAVLQSRVQALLSALPVLAFDSPAEEHYADIRNALEGAGTPIGSHDLLIAAHARAAGLTLVTHNRREFARVTGLRVEDWMAAGH